MNMKMRHTSIWISAVILLSMLFLCSCRKNEVMYTGETTTLTLNIGAQGDMSVSTRAEDPNVMPYEGIRTLRVIIVSPDNDSAGRRILYNEKHTVDGAAPTEAILNTSVTLTNVPVGPASIYVIANEESIIEGEGYTNAVLESPTYINNYKLLVLDEEWKFFPKRYDDIAANGLPMSGKLENTTIQADAALSMKLVRAVVKIHLTVENATRDNLTLKWVKFGEFISDRVFMFREEGVSLDIPENTQYTDRQYGSEDAPMDVLLAANAKTDWKPIYILPNWAFKDQSGPNPYTLALRTDKKSYEASQFAANLNAMIRNTQFNITARITASANIEISYEQVDWTVVNIGVPEFD